MRGITWKIQQQLLAGIIGLVICTRNKKFLATYGIFKRSLTLFLKILVETPGFTKFYILIRKNNIILPAAFHVISFWFVNSSIDGTWIVATDSLIAFGTSRTWATHFNFIRELFSSNNFRKRRNRSSKLRENTRKPSAIEVCSCCTWTHSCGA